MLFLHAYSVATEPVLPGNLVALWEVIDLLELIQPFIDILFARTCAPKEIPLMALGMGKAVYFSDRPDHPIVATVHFVEKLRVLYVVATGPVTDSWTSCL